MNKKNTKVSLVRDILTRRFSPDGRALRYDHLNNQCKKLGLTVHQSAPVGVCAYPAGWPA